MNKPNVQKRTPNDLFVEFRSYADKMVAMYSELLVAHQNLSIQYDNLKGSIKPPPKKPTVKKAIKTK